MTDNAAEVLLGEKLNDRWTVVKKIIPPIGSTGGFFSICYIVEDDEGQAFLKALNFQAFFQLFRGKKILDIVQEQTRAFQYEKDLLNRCKNRRLSKVSTIIDEGEAYIDGYAIPSVPFLIFEMADGDIRSKINFAKQLDYAWKLRSLHDVAVGLMQLHSVNIGHQDLKPSNVLLYDNGSTSKVGDLGRSLCNDILAPHEDGSFPGDFSYAPPECLYRANLIDWEVRTKTTDIYLFGSLIVYYFTGLKMTTLLIKHLPLSFRPDQWGGRYSDVESYIVDSFTYALVDLRSSIGETSITDEIVQIVEYCCNPIPEKRGHPQSLNKSKNRFDFARIVSLLDIYTRKAELKLL